MKEVKIYTLDYCPYCMKAKMLFDKHNIVYDEIHCEDDEENMRRELTKMYNLPDLATFPQIIIDGKNIGGYSDLISLIDSGELAL